MNWKKIIVFLKGGDKKILGPFQAYQVKTQHQIDWEIDWSVPPKDIENHQVVDVPPPKDISK